MQAYVITMSGLFLSGLLSCFGTIWKSLMTFGMNYSFIHLVVCLTTGPKPLPKRALHIVRSRASSFKWEYPLLFLRSSISFLRLLPCLPVTSIHPPPLVTFLQLLVVEGSFCAKCDQSSSPSVYVFHVGCMNYTPPENMSIFYFVISHNQ
jgi:hypothetical protein